MSSVLSEGEMTWAEIGDQLGVTHTACLLVAQNGIRKLWRMQVRSLRIGSIATSRREDVLRLRAAGQSQKAIAVELGMAQSSVSRILKTG